jgi:hypothetical protein
MSSKSLRSRRPLTLLARITLVALCVNALVYASELIRLGLFDPEVSTVVALLRDMGLLVLAEYLCVQRLRNVFLTPER